MFDHKEHGTSDSLGLVRLATAGKRLDCSRSSLYRLRDQGLLEFVYLTPGMPRVRKRQLAALEEEGAEIEAIIREGTRPVREGRRR